MEGFKMKKIIWFLIFLAVIGKFCFAADEHLYSTWDVLELDTCASAWLIKKFVDTQAEFRFYPKGEFITEGVAFDTPDAKFRRTRNMSTFETIVQEYRIEDEALFKIAEMIHDIEINFWVGDLTQEAKVLNQEVLEIIRQTKIPQEAFKRSFPVFDELYRGLKR